MLQELYLVYFFVFCFWMDINYLFVELNLVLRIKVFAYVCNIRQWYMFKRNCICMNQMRLRSLGHPKYGALGSVYLEVNSSTLMLVINEFYCVLKSRRWINCYDACIYSDETYQKLALALMYSLRWIRCKFY